MPTVLLVTGLVAGGVGRHVADLVTGLAARGHGVRVACPTVVAEQFGLPERGAEVVRLEIGDRPYPLRDRRALAALRRAQEAADVVHAHGVRAGALAALARRRAAPLVVTTHNAAPGTRLSALAHRGLHRLVCRRADLVLGVSPDLVAAAQAAGARRVGPAVVAAPQAQPRRGRGRVRSELELRPGHPLLVTVGRLAAQKGHDVLLDALADPRVQSLDPVTLLVGEGPLRPGLERRLATERLPVRLLGHRRDVPDLLAAADLVVSAARWEGQPIWLQEALALGAPVLATDAGGTAEVLGDAGVLVPPGDAPALATALADLLGDPRRLAEQAERSRHRAATLPTPDDAVRAALTAYRRATLTGRPARDVDW